MNPDSGMTTGCRAVFCGLTSVSSHAADRPADREWITLSKVNGARISASVITNERAASVLAEGFRAYGLLPSSKRAAQRPIAITGYRR